ncbi:MAG: hypothetical protein AAGI52_06490 [Bacteroidota bacterium]
MDCPLLRDRYTLAERQAVLHGFAHDGPVTREAFVQRVREILAPRDAGDLLSRLVRDEVVVMGRYWNDDDERPTATMYALVGSLLQPAPHYPDPTPTDS